MPRTRIKICGTCSADDALLAAEAGADAVGMVFYDQAKRRVELDEARRILRLLPPFVTPVALFVDADPAVIERTASDLRIRHVQLHGNESPDLVARLPDLAVLKALRGDRDTLRQHLRTWLDAAPRLPNLKGFVLDTPSTSAPGGTGEENDWAALADVMHQAPRETRFIVAGGLRPDNVAQVVRQLRPYAVDVSSGVESSLRHKSPEKVLAFIQAVRQADPA